MRAMVGEGTVGRRAGQARLVRPGWRLAAGRPWTFRAKNGKPAAMEQTTASDLALEELIAISREVGADPDLVQGGGGNTSVKTRDESRMLVKASGTALGDMDRERGWAELDLEALRNILARNGLAGLPPADREAEVLQLLGR